MTAVADRQTKPAEVGRYGLGGGTQTSFGFEDVMGMGCTYLSVPRVPNENEHTVSLLLEANDAWAREQLRMLVWSALSRTQGLVPDEVRIVIGPVAGRLGRPVRHPELSVADSVRALRERTALPASEVAHMLGVRRRQLYKLAEPGSSTTPEREARLHALNEVVDELDARFGDPTIVRSCLLAPIGKDLNSFVDLVSTGDVQTAREALWAYLDSRGARGVPAYIERPTMSERRREDASDFIRSTRDITPSR
jgi:hypothetical protein